MEEVYREEANKSQETHQEGRDAHGEAQNRPKIAKITNFPKVVQEENILRIPAIRQQETAFRAGAGFLDRATNCLILKNHPKYEFLLLSKSRIYVNSLALKPNSSTFELIFTHKEATTDLEDRIEDAKFLTNAVDDQSKILLRNSNGELFGLSVHLQERRITFKRVKPSPDDSETNERFMTHVEDCLLQKSPQRSLRRLCVSSREGIDLQICLCLKNRLKAIFDFEGLLGVRRRVENSLNSVFLKRRHKIGLILVLGFGGKSGGNWENESIRSVVLASESAVVVLKMNLRLRKVLKRAKIEISEIEKFVKIKNRFGARGNLSINSPVFDPVDASLVLTVGVYAEGMGRRFGTSWKLIRVKNVFRGLDEGSLVVRDVKNYSRLLDFGRNRVLVEMTKNGDKHPKKLFFVDSGTLETRGEYEEASFFAKTLREVYFDDDEVRVDKPKNGQKGVIFRTNNDIAYLTEHQLDLLFPKNPQKGQKSPNSENEKNRKNDENSAFPAIPYTSHCYRPKRWCHIQAENDLLFFLKPGIGLIQIFKTGQNELTHVARVTIGRETGHNLGSLSFARELLNGDVVILANSVSSYEYGWEKGFNLIKVSKASREVVKCELVEAGGGRVVSNLNFSIFGENFFVAFFSVEKEKHVFLIEMGDLEVKYHGCYDEERLELAVFVKNGEIFCRENFGDFEDSELPWLKIVADWDAKTSRTSMRVIKSPRIKPRVEFSSIPGQTQKELKIEFNPILGAQGANRKGEGPQPSTLRVINAYYDAYSRVIQSGRFFLGKMWIYGRGARRKPFFLVDSLTKLIYVLNYQIIPDFVLKMDVIEIFENSEKSEKIGFEVVLMDGEGVLTAFRLSKDQLLTG